ncbi:helix-turn-helix domain-containing protein [Pectobacterium parmentieri]|nr:helix-turn-helix domain-containing protein [Pectobacterium parmentieri]PWD66052.1 hypothetical protein DF211_06625 [Pectobacterium parmentieri]
MVCLQGESFTKRESSSVIDNEFTCCTSALSGWLASSTLANALTRHRPKGERLIAETMGERLEEIWPGVR